MLNVVRFRGRQKEKGFGWQECVAIFILLLSPCVSSGKGSVKEVDIVERISGFLSSVGGYELVETGNLDIDDDGDLDLLVEAHKDKDVIKRGRWTVYFNEDGKYVHADRQSIMPLHRQNLSFRQIKQSGGKRALVWYNPDKEGFFRAYWYNNKGGKYKKRSAVASEDYLLTPQDDAIVGPPADKWEDKGLKVEDLLINYKRYSSEENARKGLREQYE